MWICDDCGNKFKSAEYTDGYGIYCLECGSKNLSMKFDENNVACTDINIEDFTAEAKKDVEDLLVEVLKKHFLDHS